MRDKVRFPECGMTEVEWFEVDDEGKPCPAYQKSKTPTPCDHSRCQYSEEGERDYLERLRKLNASDGTPYLRVNGGPGNPWARS